MECRKAALVVAAIFLSMLLSQINCQANPTDGIDPRRQSAVQPETTTANFIRLLVMRLVFGIASVMGLGENLSNFLGGVFVPPGVDYDDDYDIVPDLF